jgi:hypothetical protein
MSQSTGRTDDRRTGTRRAYLSAAIAISLSAVAGCTSDGDSGDGSEPSPNDESDDTPSDDDQSEPGDSGGSTTDGSDGEGTIPTDYDGVPPAEGTAHMFDAEIPADPAFIANPTVSGPGGDAEVVLPLGVSSRGDQDSFDEFVVWIESVVLDGDAGSVTIPVETQIDTNAYEYGGMARGDTITVGWRLPIPAGSYDSVSFVCSPVEIVHESVGDVSDLFETGSARPFEDDGSGVAVEPDALFRPLPTFRITYEPWDDRLSFAPEAETVGYHVSPSQYFDPSEYGA